MIIILKPYSIFSPLLENSKEYKPALHFALKQLSIINSHTKSRKNKVLKSKRGVKREKMSERLLRDLASASNTGKVEIQSFTIFLLLTHIHTKYIYIFLFNIN